MVVPQNENMVRVQISNLTNGFRGFTGLGVQLSLRPQQILPLMEVPEKALPKLRRAGLAVKEVPVKEPEAAPEVPAKELDKEPEGEVPVKEPEVASKVVPETLRSLPSEEEIRATLAGYSKADLLKICRENELDTEGNKADLIQRIVDKSPAE